MWTEHRKLILVSWSLPTSHANHTWQKQLAALAVLLPLTTWAGQWISTACLTYHILCNGLENAHKTARSLRLPPYTWFPGPGPTHAIAKQHPDWYSHFCRARGCHQRTQTDIQAKLQVQTSLFVCLSEKLGKIQHSFKCTEYLCILCKEYSISLTSQFCTLSRQYLEPFDISHS